MEKDEGLVLSVPATVVRDDFAQTGARLYSVNCAGCGTILQVVSPRLDREPKVVRVLGPGDGGITDQTDRYKYMKAPIGCRCGAPNKVQFEY